MNAWKGKLKIDQGHVIPAVERRSLWTGNLGPCSWLLCALGLGLSVPRPHWGRIPTCSGYGGLVLQVCICSAFSWPACCHDCPGDLDAGIAAIWVSREHPDWPGPHGQEWWIDHDTFDPKRLTIMLNFFLILNIFVLCHLPSDTTSENVYAVAHQVRSTHFFFDMRLFSSSQNNWSCWPTVWVA